MARRHENRRQTPLQPREGSVLPGDRVAVRRAFSSSIGRMILISAVVAFKSCHNALVNAKTVSPHPLFHVSRLRGGFNSDGNLPSGGVEEDFNDEELDEYIDFLLAYADDKATEADNPLFRDNVNDSPLQEVEDVEMVEEDNVVDSIGVQENSMEVPAESVIEPMVDDVNDNAQLDTMVETLVASIDDDDTSSIPVLDTAQIDDTAAEAVQARDSVEVDNTVEVEALVDNPIDVDDSRDETTEINVEELANQPEVEGTVESKVSLESTVAVDIQDATLEKPTVESVDVAHGEEHVDEGKVESDAFYLGSSAVENMPPPVNEEISLVDDDLTTGAAESTIEPTKRAPLFSSFMQKLGLKKADLQSADTAIVDSADQVEDVTIGGVDLDGSERKVEETSEANSEDFEPAVAAATAVNDPVENESAKTTVFSSAKQYYQGALGSLKDFWSRKPWYSRATDENPPERDYSKIYNKYFAANHEKPIADAFSDEEKSSRLRSAFVKPWGTVSRFFTEFDEADDYSIGIKGFVTEDVTAASTSFEAEVDKDLSVQSEDVKLDSSKVSPNAEDDSEKEVVKDLTVDIGTDDISAEAKASLVESIDEDISAEVEVIAERTEVETAKEEISTDEEVLTEVTEVQVETQMVVEDEFDSTEVAEADAEVEEAIEAEELIAEGNEAGVDSEEIPEDSIEADSVYDVDVDEVIEAGKNEAEEILEEGKIVNCVADSVDDVEVDEVISEGTKAEETLEEAGIVDSVEVDSEEYLEVEEVVESEDIEVEVDSEEIPEDEGIVDSVEVVVDVDENFGDSSQSAYSKEDTDGKEPRRASIFTRLWGTTKIPKSVDTEKIDKQLAEEEATEESDQSTDELKIMSEVGVRQPNLFVRLWGTTKNRNENYSLGLQGFKENGGLETGEDVDATSHHEIGETLEEGLNTGVTEDDESYAGEEIDVDISVSIGIVEGEDSLDVDSLDISDSSGAEDSEDERDVLQLHIPEKQDIGENMSPEIVSIEDTHDKRNVLQLDIPERETESSLHEDSNIPDFGDDIDASGSIPDEVNDESREEELGIDYYPDVDVVEGDMEEIISDSDEEILFSVDGGDNHEDPAIQMPTNVDQYTISEEEHSIEESDEGEDFEKSIVVDAEERILSNDVELIEEEDVEEDIEGSFVLNPIEQDDLEEDFDEEVIIELSEDNDILEVKSEEGEEVYVDEADAVESLISEETNISPYSLEAEIQNAHFLTRFLINRGLEQLIMVAIVIVEWFRLYVLTPFLDSVDWIVEGKGQDLIETVQGKGQDLFQTVLNTRGGALAPTLSEDEDETQTDVEDVKIEDAEKLPTEKENTDLADVNESEIDDENGDRADPVESEALASETQPAEKLLPSSRRVPPNFIFRYLVNCGMVGHILIMELILASEWLNVYVPQIQSLLSFFMYDVLKHKKNFDLGPEEPDNYMDGGFVHIGEGSRVGKKSRKIRKKEDQKALDQLKRIGNVNEAKYRFISERFMERHGLGPYNVAFSEIEVDSGSSFNDRVMSNNDVAIVDSESESDSGWILNALGVDEEDTAQSSVPFDTNVGVSIGSGGPKVSVGFELSVGKKRRKESSSQKLRNTIVGNDKNRYRSKTKKPLKPHTSDSESGIIGRLRAQGANSLVGRSILGAYPGDLPPPDEAADPRGVIDLAYRYGYGDWSDEEDSDVGEFPFSDDETDDDENFFADEYSVDDELRSEKRSRRRVKRKKRRSSPSRNQHSVGVGFDVDLRNPSQDSSSLSNASSRRRRSTSTSSSSSSGTRRRRRSSGSSRFPSAPMETLGGGSGSRSTLNTSTSTTNTIETTKQSSDTSIKDIVKESAAKSLRRKRKTKTLSPAMSILDETKKSEASGNTKSQDDNQ